MSFIADKIVMDGLTYDDVLLIPAYSEVLPKTVELTTKFSRNIELKVPFVTAAMDTVTEAKMAIAIAREGEDYISGALGAMLDLGQGSGPMDHGFDLTGKYMETAKKA